jgi:purine-binding chemotaxis protein CheW
MTDTPITDLAATLRKAFDTSFADVPRPEAGQRENLLAIRVGGNPFALRLEELAGLSTGWKIAALPTPVSGLLGIAGFRGALVPVYDLRNLFGYPAQEAPHWLALVGEEALTALAFDGFDGYLRVLPETVTRHGGEHSAALLKGLVQVGDMARPIVHLPSVIDTLKQRAHSIHSRKET